MRHILVAFMLMTFFSTFGQIETFVYETFFIQIKLSSADDLTYSQIEQDLKNNPHIGLIRLDKLSNGLIIGTKNLSSLTREDAESWLGEHSALIECYYQGIHGVQTMYAFNEEFCSTIPQD